MSPLRTALLVLLVAYSGASDAAQVLLPRPPMGYNDWSVTFCALNETLFTKTAEAMISLGLQKAGYNRLNLDDCWPLGERAANGSLQWDPEKFPHGLPWLAKYMNDRGFSLGIYSDAGNKTCGGYPGSFGYEEIDAATFSSWGIDYLKLDGCNMPDTSETTYQKVYGHWHEVLNKLPQPLIFSESAPAYFAEADNLSDWYSVMDWVPQYGQLARHSRDTLVWNSTLYWPDITGWDSIMFNYGQEVRLARYQRPGYYNDPDFLNVDHANYTIHEKRSHFALWSSLSAPLIISAYIPALTPEEVGYLTNLDLIAVDQDPLGLQATLVSQDGTWDVLTKDLAGGDRLITVLNRGNWSASHTVPFSRIGISSSHTVPYRLKDLWSGQFSHVSNEITATDVPPHGTAVFRLSSLNTPIEIIPTGMIFNTYSLNCLTSSAKGSTSWAPCDAGDAQVWQTPEDGTVRSLLDTSKCLTDSGAHAPVYISSCDRHNPQQVWKYSVTGNLRSSLSGLCLTEGIYNATTSTKCGWETNAQVIALPGGIKLW
ncbi:carbohydrate-binding module family 13 protein [Oidiodendron maius Zn]|uniref:Alpha-galactosidase n=1 Tax=Oidiodendron maius (strain Zn) TaxID=913774 RepID=A0A0C3DPH7_OIDMZ|nr:carbohydrate-binding module family 13 protein [Oidiodendron maius Zn]